MGLVYPEFGPIFVLGDTDLGKGGGVVSGLYSHHKDPLCLKDLKINLTLLQRMSPPQNQNYIHPSSVADQ